MADTSLIDKIVVGRVTPHIYAFSTNTIPNYLKVGDTYRSVDERLTEWRRHFNDLTPVFSKEATVDNLVYFRDYSLHKYLTDEKGKIRLLPSSPDFPTGIYFSNEFFKDVVAKELDDGISDILNDYQNTGGKYEFYDINKKLPIPFTYSRTEDYKPRPNQQETIDKFIDAINRGRKNLLMYAVMRYGKSFTSMCFAKEMKANCVVIVSAKADVEDEWKKTIETHKWFADYVFITSKDLRRNNRIITEYISHGKRVAVFLTLQDLSGKEIKTKHKELFAKKKLIDLLIVDETHFGARADELGKAIKEEDKDIEIPDYSKELITEADARNIYKHLNRKITLHLSGTPYRLLMGSEFSKEDIICFCQFSDIIQAQEKWNQEWLLKDIYDDKKCEEFGKKEGDLVREWDNPYFGFPKMIRFAFNPNESTQQKLMELEKQGYSFAFSKLLKPKSIKKTSYGDHKLFDHENEVLDLFKAIDGSKNDNNIFPFLNYDKIINGKMCRHMVIVLPYCASCDALEALFVNHKSEFLRLGEYEIINISGVENTKKYKVNEIIERISKCEANNKKTITLTVQRMLTGSTVKEWDTMIFLKDTASPQEYDQAIFRLQNQYVVSALDDKTGEVVKIDMKPQTLLVDFAPNRMFYMQEKKAQIYNANVDKTGNSKLGERIKEELRISPIIVLNKDKMEIVDETNILEAVSNYNKDKGINEEVKEIPIDLRILDNKTIYNLILQENELTSKSGLETKAGQGKGKGLDIDIPGGGGKAPSSKTTEQNPSIVLINKIRNYYRRLLLFAFLSKTKLISLQDIINSLSNKDNKRIAKNVGLDKKVLQELIKSFSDVFALSGLDYKIQDINSLSHDSKKTAEEKVSIAINKFGKLGDAIVSMTQETANKIIDQIGSKAFSNIITGKQYILDLASTSGELALALSKTISNNGINQSAYKNKIISIPKDSICYELTRKVYEMVGLEANCVIENVTSFDLLNLMKSNGTFKTDEIYLLLRKNKVVKEHKQMIKFGAIVGNPPYQRNVAQHVSETNGQPRTQSIFHYFQNFADQLSSKYVSLIYPGARWIHRSGKGMEQFGLKQINDISLVRIDFYPDSREIFKEVDVGDGISIVLKDKEKTTNGFDYVYHKGTYSKKVHMNNPGPELIPLDPRNISIVNKVVECANKNGFSFMSKRILPQKLFGIESSFVQDNPSLVRPYSDGDQLNKGEIKLLTNDKAGKAGRAKWYITNRSNITTNAEYIDKWKVTVSGANAGGQKRDRNLMILDNQTAFGRVRLGLGAFNTEEEAKNFYKYVETNIIKFLFLMTEESLTSLGKKVLDIGDYSSTSPIDFSKDVEKELAALIGLTSEEMECIEETIKALKYNEK